MIISTHKEASNEGEDAFFLYFIIRQVKKHRRSHSVNQYTGLVFKNPPSPSTLPIPNHILSTESLDDIVEIQEKIENSFEDIKIKTTSLHHP